MICHDVRRYLGACLDGELEPTLTLELERHLAECDGCREQSVVHAELKRHVRTAVRSERAPEALRERVVAALATAPMDRRPAGSSARMLPMKYAIPMAAAAAIAITTGALRQRGGDGVSEAGVAPLLEDVVRGHARAFPVEVKVEGTGGEEVASWFRDKVEFPVRPIQFGSAHARLLGARLSNVREHQAATLYYDVDGRRVTVFVFEPTSLSFAGALHTQIAGREVFYGSVRGYSVAIVRRNGVAYAISSDLDQRSVLRLAAAARIQ